MFQFEVQSQL